MTTAGEATDIHVNNPWLWVIGTGLLLFVTAAIFQTIHYFTVFLS